MKITIKSPDDLESAAKSFLKVTKGHHIFAFEGEMGVGKTTFINAILKELNITDHSSSPTFSIVNEYESSKYGTVYHFDFYRIEDETEALDIGVEDIIYGTSYCFMEWPSKIKNLLPEETVNVKMKVEKEQRLIEIML